MPSGCLFCRRKQRLFRINMVYDSTGKPIKNFILEFLGSCEQYLDDDNGICSTCVFLLNKLLFLRKYMYLLAASTRDDECNNTPHLKFSYVYKYFLENLQKVSYEDCDSEADNNLSELLRVVHSSPYEEEQGAQYERSFGTPHADREVEDTIRRRRGRSKGRGKRRGHNWTRHKSSGSRAKSRMTTYSEPAHEIGRADLSRVNLSEYYDSDRSDSDDENDNEVATNMENSERHLNGILQNRRTFSPDPDETVVIRNYKCINGCSSEFHSLEEMTNHKVNVHGMLANYVCYECYATKFVSPEDLKLHNDLLHHTLISNCFLCSAELRTIEGLQKHLREHRFHSYPCRYCDMFFLDRQSCKAHISECHKGKRKRIRRSERCTLIGQMFKSNDTFTKPSELDEKYRNKIIWRLQNRKPVKKLSTICIDVIKQFYQGSIDVSSLIEDPCISVTPNKSGNHTVMEISDSTESSIQMENELTAENDQSMEINCNETQSNSEDVPNPVMLAETTDNGTKDTDIFHEEIDDETLIVNGILDIPDDIPEIMTETDVYTSEEIENDLDCSSKPGTSDSSSVQQNKKKANVLRTTADNFERFMKSNSAKDDQLDETKSNAKTLNNKNNIKWPRHLNDR